MNQMEFTLVTGVIAHLQPNCYTLMLPAIWAATKHILEHQGAHLTSFNLFFYNKDYAFILWYEPPAVVHNLSF